MMFFAFGCSDNSGIDNSLSSDDVIITKKAVNKSLDGTTDDVTLNIDCSDSAYEEVPDNIDQLKNSDESLKTIEVSNVIEDSSTKRINFDLQITQQQINTIASQSEEEILDDTSEQSSSSKGWFDKEKYCATGGRAYLTFQCSNGRMEAEHKQYKSWNKVTAWVTAIYYFPNGVDSVKRKKCPKYCSKD